MNNHGVCFGYQSIQLSTTASSGLTIPGNPKYANAIMIRIEGAEARFQLNGTIPTTGATGGFPIFSTDTSPLWLEPSQGGLIDFQAIAATTGGTVLHALYFGVGEK